MTDAAMFRSSSSRNPTLPRRMPAWLVLSPWFVVACAHVYYRMAGSDHADPELQAKIVRMAREHWRAALRVPNSKKREKSKLWMLICCPAAGRWMWRLGKKLKQG